MYQNKTILIILDYSNACIVATLISVSVAGE